MPIRINLLAEAQAAEELRRKDPIKRAIVAAVVVVVVVLAYIGLLISQGMEKKKELARLNKRWAEIKPRFDQIKRNATFSADAQWKASMLQEYSTNRFLWATVLNALAQVATNSFATNVQLSRLVAEQDFVTAPAVKAVTNTAGKIITPARPAGIAERDKVLIFARDYGRDIDENYNKFKDALAEHPFFKAILETGGKGARLLDVTSRKTDQTDPTKTYMEFVIECQFTQRIR